jgi:hypothetical protein
MLTDLIKYVLFIVLWVFVGCEPWSLQDRDWMGGGELVLELPVRQGKELMCVQGAHGSFSHSADNTRYDIDLDTSNSIDDEVYANASGIAYVHTESATSGFGYHVNIDVGNGQYVVIAHLSDIFIRDGMEVAVGELIGYEGCTGFCTGDHIHVGLHEGSATQTADQGVSIPVYYRTADASTGGGVEIISSEDFICGIRSEGDPQDGHFYESDLSVPFWHPNGSLVKTPDNARVYLLKDDRASWIENEGVFWSHGYDFDEVVLVSDEELSCYGAGSEILSTGFIHAVFDTEEDLWLLVGMNDDPDRYRILVQGAGWEAVMASWGLGFNASNWPDTHADNSVYLTDWPPASGTAKLRDGTLVTEESSSDVYFISDGWALPIFSWDVFLMMGLVDRTILTVQDGVVASLHENRGNCITNHRCVDDVAVTTCGGGLELGSGGSYGGDPSTGDAGDEFVDEDGDGYGSTVDCDDSDPSVWDDCEDDSYEDEGQQNSGGDSPTCSGEDACLIDQDGDGKNDTLLMKDDLWLTTSRTGEPAYIYANGGCYDGSLTTADLVYANTYGYYKIDFSSFSGSCAVELSLIASVGTNGESPDSSMGNWYWWQNASFCAQGQSLCELKNNGTSWEEWLIAVSWSPSSGLRANGNGYTSNTQL